MNRNLSNEELVNRYLDHEMDKMERLDFENRLVNESDLREEYNFQNDLIEGIKQSRRLELKARFANIPINNPFYKTLVGKAVVVVSASAVIGIGSYYLLRNKNEAGLSKVDLKREYAMRDSQKVVPAIPNAQMVKEEPEKIEAIHAPKKNGEPNLEASRKKVVTIKKPMVKPDVVKPNVATGLKEEEAHTESINSKSLNSMDRIQENVENKVMVETIEDRKNNFHYKFFDNKLYLLGKFKDIPYEIIELNEKAGKKYFLFYDDNYYRLKTDRVKPTPLVKIENDSIIQELRIIQKNK